MLRKFLLGAPALATVHAAKPQPPVEPEKPPPMKPSELPIYEAPHSCYATHQQLKKSAKCAGGKESALHEMLQPPVSAVRVALGQATDSAAGVTSYVSDTYKDAVDKSDWIVKYLREEDNTQQRYGAVAVGGLTGFIFGLRGGFIRKIFYTGLGTGIMSALCFPEETDHFAREAVTNGRHYANVAYNFFYGVKPGDPQMEIKFPELSVPTNFSEFSDMAIGVAKSLKQAVMPPPSEESKSEKKE